MPNTDVQKTEATTPPFLEDLEGTKEAIRRATEKIIAAKARRKKCNDQIAAERESLKELGVNMKGFALALAAFEHDQAKRLAIDTSYNIAREALGIQLELDMAGFSGATVN